MRAMRCDAMATQGCSRSSPSAPSRAMAQPRDPRLRSPHFLIYLPHSHARCSSCNLRAARGPPVAYNYNLPFPTLSHCRRRRRCCERHPSSGLVCLLARAACSYVCRRLLKLLHLLPRLYALRARRPSAPLQAPSCRHKRQATACTACGTCARVSVLLLPPPPPCVACLQPVRAA